MKYCHQEYEENDHRTPCKKCDPQGLQNKPSNGPIHQLMSQIHPVSSTGHDTF